MSVPDTYLLTAPNTTGDLFGQAMPSHNLIQTLKKVDRRVWTDSVLYGPPTCLWIGEHQNKKASRKMSSIPTGVIPEFTQLAPEGMIVALGWRRILEKCIRYGRMDRAALEKAFGRTLDVGGEGKNCRSCKQLGQDVKANGKGAQCDFHSNLIKKVWQERQEKDELAYQRRVSGCPPTP